MSRSFDSFLADVKRAAVEAVNASKPFALTFGTVVSVSPLKIQVDQKLTLVKEQLILTNAVRDYKVYMTMDHMTENTSGGSGESAFASHAHSYKGKKSFTVHMALKNGERVILLRANGGQQYVVLDRVEVPST